MPAATLYAFDDFIRKYPRTTQALANAIVRADRWLATAGPSDVLKTVPENYQLGDKALYLAAFASQREAYSTDGLMPESGPQTAAKALASFDPKIDPAKIDLADDLHQRLRQAGRPEGQVSESLVAPGPAVAALEFDHVTCTFVSEERPDERYTAVEDVTLAVAPGEFVSVVGPTGCGKSTLLNIGAGLLAPSSGSVRVFGQALDARLGELNRRAGYMFQAEALMPWRSALDNVTAGLAFRGIDRGPARALAYDWLARVGLSGFETRYPHQLSGGMRKRVALAQTLVLDPDIVLMDEPFSALDVQTRQLMENELLDAVAGEAEGRALHHARPRRGDRAVRPRRRAVGRPGHAPDRELRHRSRASARRGGDPHRPAFRRVARPHLADDEGRGPEGLSPDPDADRMKRRTVIRAWQVAVLATVLLLWYALTSRKLLPTFYFANADQAAFFFGEPLRWPRASATGSSAARSTSISA